MKTLKKTISMLMVASMALMSGVFTSCDDDDYDTNPFKGGVSLTAAQLQVTRGSYMQFKGTGLEQITSIVFPVDVAATPEVLDKYTIRCIVPEEATVGTVKLIYSAGALETAEPIGFNEPVEITEYTKSGKAGDVFTISGRYLEYFTHARFATGEAVELQSVSRNEVKVVAPVDASTGEMVLLNYTEVSGEKIANETPVGEVTLAETNVVLPKDAVKNGEEIELTGDLLRLVQTIKFQGADAVDVAAEDPTKDRESIKVVVPIKALAGDVEITLLSGVKINAGAIALKAVTAAIADKKDSYGVKDVVKITGENLDLVAKVAFDGADAIDAKVEDGAISVEVTAPAKTGNITLTLKNGTTVSVEGFVTTKPVVSDLVEAATPLDKVVFTSTLATRVVKVLFGEVEAETATTETTFSVILPLEAENEAAITLVMDNGETVSIDKKIKLNAINFAAVSKLSDKEVVAGDIYKCEIINPEALTGVRVNNTDVKYILNGNTLYVLTEPSMSGDKKLVLVSGEKEASFAITLAAAGIVETTIWEGEVDLNNTSWGVAFTALQWGSWDQYKEFFTEGMTIKMYYAISEGAEYTAIRWGNGSWEGLPGFLNNNGGNASGDFSVDMEATSFEYTLTAEDVENLNAKGGFGIFGYGIVLTKLVTVVDYSAPTPIWEGSVTIGNWDGSMAGLAYGAFDWSKVKVGQTLYAYVTMNEGAEYAQVRFGNGSWAGLPSTKTMPGADEKGEGNISISAETTELSFKLAQEDLDELTKNNGLVMCGANYTITKVAIK